MITDYKSFVAYFQSIASTHRSPLGFLTGDMMTLVDAERGNITYPLLFLEDPDIDIIERPSQDNRIVFTVGVLIVDSCRHNSPEQEAAKKQSTWLLARDVVSKILSDYLSSELELSSPVRIPLRMLARQTGDQYIGWRMELTIDVPNCFDLIPNNWTL